MNKIENSPEGQSLSYTVTAARKGHSAITIQFNSQVFPGEKILYRGSWLIVHKCVANFTK